MMEKKNRPFLLKASNKDYLWGGRRLKDDYTKETDVFPLAETWECSTHPDGPSFVASGIAQGYTLQEVLTRHPEFIGTHPCSLLPGEAVRNGEIPVLVKLIDAKENLSIQVHPDDEYAKEHEQGSLGKTEMWYVLEAEKDSEIVYGFHHNLNRKLLEESLRTGSVEKYLQKVKVHPGDVFLIESGTVHAIGKGILLAEIQENSNITYRMYDYGRRDKEGNLRQLQIKKALDVVNMQASLSPRQPIRTLRYRPGYASELLCRCKYFQVERIRINTENSRSMARVQTDETTFQIFLCYSGCGVLLDENGYAIHFFKGDCIFVPANSVPLKFHGSAQMLKVNC